MAFYSQWSVAEKRVALIAALYVVFMVVFGLVGIPAKYVAGFIAALVLTALYGVGVWFVWAKILDKKL